MTSSPNAPFSRSNIAARTTMGEVTNQLSGTRPRAVPQPHRQPEPAPEPLGFVAAGAVGPGGLLLYLCAMPPAPPPNSNAQNAEGSLSGEGFDFFQGPDTGKNPVSSPVHSKVC